MKEKQQLSDIYLNDTTFSDSVSSNVSIELRMRKIDVFSPRLGSLPCNVCQPTTGHGKEVPIKEKNRPENTSLTIIRPVNSHGLCASLRTENEEKTLINVGP